MIDFVIRPYLRTDREFVVDAWLNTARAASKDAVESDWDAFRTHYNKRIDSILDDSGTTVRIAAPEDDEVTVYGFLVLGPKLLHMVFVKKPFRRQGIAKQLLAGVDTTGATFTHWSRDFGHWIMPRFQRQVGVDMYGKPRLQFKDGVKFNPYFHEAT